MQLGGLILCGGKSQRMGQSKAMLPFHGVTMLERVIDRVGGVADPLVVVSAADQELPPLDPSIQQVTDRRPEQGPLEGLRAGFEQLQDRCEAAFVTSCDVPHLNPAFIQRLVELLGEDTVAVPQDDKFLHPLSAVYRVSVLPTIVTLLESGERRPRRLFDQVPTRKVPLSVLREVDPQLRSLMNVNTPEEYEAALEVE